MKKRQGAYSLVEMLVYISVVVVLLGVGYAALYRCMDNCVALRRSADDIANAVRAGEQWRTDVRAAKAGIRLESNSTGQVLLLTTSERKIAYRFSDNTVFRRVGNGGWSPMLSN